MSLEAIRFYNTFLALLALLALGLALGLVVYRVVRGPEAASRWGNRALWLAWLVALVATSGSLVYSEVIHYVPCRLCWFQRIAMYPMSVVLLVGAVRKDLAARFYALPLALIGLLISIWHYTIQVFPSLEGGSCDPLNPCSARYVEVLGFISIPFMAGAGFTLIAVLLLFYVRATRT
ncbi:MAG TPA: disulfide oxidoreductase [Acidimicrobiia bacterium]